MKRYLLVMMVGLACAWQAARAAEIQKADNTEPLAEGASWVGGVAPGAADEAVWGSAVTTANASALTNAVTWNGLKVTNPGGPVTISGSAVLSLDGGAAIDVNLQNATQDLTVEAPVAILFANGVNNVAAGRTLTHAGPLTFTSAGVYEAQGEGTVVMKGPVTSSVNTTLEIEKGKAILTGEYGGMTLSGTAARIYVGRNGGNGTLVVSNGVHMTGSANDEANANFVGVGAWGRLYIEGGSLTMRYLREAINGGSAEVVVNGGELSVWGGSATATRSGYALMIGNQHQDNGTATSGSGTLTVNGGSALFTNGIIKIGSDSAASTGAQTVNLNGGEMALKRFYVGASVQVAKTVNLNGGLLRVTGNGELFDGPGGTNGTLAVNVGDGGALIDTGANAVTLTPPLLAAGTGGLTKRGTGRLTLAGANTYAGRTRVLEGTLGFRDAAAALTPDLAVASRAALSLADGALATFEPSALVFGSAAVAAALELELAADSAACDTLAVPAGAALGRVAVAPVRQGTSSRASRVGDYVIVTYAGGAPDIGLFSVPDPAPSRVYSFLLDAEARTVTLRIAYAPGESVWVNPGGGDWETAGNWSEAPANAAGTRVRFGDALAAPATVTAAAPVTLGAATFDTEYAVTLAGGGYTFDNGASDASLSAARGAHRVAAALTLADDLSAAPAAGAALALDGVVDGSGALVKDGAGELLLTAANTYAGGTVIKAGSLLVAENASLGTGRITADGGGGIRFNYASTVTLTNDLVIAQTANLNCLSNAVDFTGAIDWQGSARALGKTGPYELTVSGSGAETALSRFVIEQGVLRFADGADFALLSTAERDAFNMKANNTYARGVVIEAGAQVTAAGVDMEFGVSNTVTVSGGALTLTGGGASTDAVAMRGQGEGVDRFVVNGGTVTCAAGSWFGVGFRTGDAHLTVNGGTATLSRVSLGARDLDMDLSARGFVEINGGLLEVNGNFGWMGSSTGGRTNIVTLGNGTPGSGVWRTCATANPRFDRSNTPILRFNGGTLEALGLAVYGASSLADYLYGAKEVYVDEGGARVDTRGLDIGLAQPLRKGAATDGGLTKLGAGALTLTGACAFTGATDVQAGLLTLPAAYASTGVTVASGAALSLANGVIQTQAFDTVTFQNGAALVFEASADGSACDRIELPAGATLGDLDVAVVLAGTATPASKPGDYPLFSFAGSAPSVAGWSLLSAPEGRSWSFEVVDSTVVLRLAYAGGLSIWTLDSSGDWETAGNWNAAPADTAGTAVRFDDAITAPATVTRASGSTVGSVAFNNAAAYTLAGAALTLANLGDAPAEVAAESGTHAVVADLNLTSNATLRAAAGAALALNGALSGATSVKLLGPGTVALPDTSGLAVDAVELADAAVVAVSNSATWSTPLALGAGGGTLAPAAGQTLVVDAAVTGAGGLGKDVSSFLMLTNGNALYAGPTTVKAGTLRLDALPDSDLVFGQGTLHYVGAPTTVTGGYMLNTGDDGRAGVLRADGDITFQGNVQATSGALVKTGPGTVTFSAPGLNIFNAGNGAGTSHSVLDIGPYGDSPTVGFSGFNVVDGKVVIGAQGQTNLFNGLLVVGLNSTTNADAETAGQLDVTGGRTTVTDALIVGRSNGSTTTAPTARVSKLRVTDGELDVQTLVLGRTLVAAGHNSAPEVALAGGLLTAANAVIVGEQAGSVGTLKLTGGTLAAPNVIRLGGQAHLVLDGGSFRPSADGQTLTGLTSATVGAGGWTLDLSLAEVYTLAQVLTTAGSDGGLTKSGAGRLVISGRQAFEGPTAISAGALRLAAAGALSNATSLAVAPGAALELDVTATQTVSLAGLTLGAAASTPVALTLAALADGTGHDRFEVAGPVSLGEVALTLVRVGLNDAFGLNGTYTLMSYTGADPSVSGLSVANPLYGKTYTFAASAGTVRLTIGTDYGGGSGASIWSAAGGGNWSDGGNWTVAPGAGGAGAKVRFDDVIAAPATVTLSSAATVGTAYFNNANAYTLDGAATLTLDGGAGTQALVAVESGAHTLAAPVAVAADGVTVQAPIGTGLTLAGAVSGSGALVKTGGGELTAAAPSARSGATEIQGGELILKDGGDTGSGELVLNNAYGVRVTGTAATTLANPVRFQSGGPILRPEAQALTLSGVLDWQTGVPIAYKWGTNELVLAGTGGGASGTPKLYVRQGGVTFISGADYVLPGNTRESIKLGLQANMPTALTVEDGASVRLGGILVSAEATTTAGNTATLVQNGGAVELTNLSGDAGTAFFLRDWGSAPATYEMNGGTFTMPAGAWANVGLHGLGLLTVNDGSMTIGRFAAGFQAQNTATGLGRSEVVVNGGRLEAAGSWSWMSDGHARLTQVTLNGGTLALPATRTYGSHAARWTALNLNGGTLELTGAALDSSDLGDYLAGLRRVALGDVSGTVDTRALEATIQQNVLSLTPTGGLAKAGGGTLTLAGTNVWWGLADVREGTLRARLTHRDLPAAALLWLGMDATVNPDLSGNGFPVSTVGSGFSAVERATGKPALTLNGAGYFSAPYNTVFTNVQAFTAAAWIRVTQTYSDSDQSIISARSGSSRAFELKLNGGNNLLRLLMHSYNSQTWWQELRTTTAVPLNAWTHVAVVVEPSGAAMYLNGVRQTLTQHVGTGGGTSQPYAGGWPYLGDIRLMPGGSVGTITVGRTTTSSGQGFRGALDEALIFERALTDAEVAALAAESPAAPGSARVAALGTLDLMGTEARVSDLSGTGRVIGGALTVERRLAPGDTEEEAPGAWLAVEGLTLGTNVVYACSCDGGASDLTAVDGLLNVNGAGVIDFGRTEANPVSGSFSVTVMTYGTVSGAANFAGWSVTGLGRRGYESTVEAVGGEVVVSLRSTFGTLIKLR